MPAKTLTIRLANTFGLLCICI